MTDRVAITDRVEQVLAILAVSGIVPSQFGIELLRKVDSGEITREEALSQIKEHYENTSTH